jgi:hypothetical protein
VLRWELYHTGSRTGWAVACWTGYRNGGLLHTYVPLARTEGLLPQHTVDPIVIIYESA